MLRFSTFCLLCNESLDWWAKENECRDSEGKRVRSSENGSAGEDGPAVRAFRDDFRDGSGESCGIGIGWLFDGCRSGEVCCLLGGGGCWRIRRRPVSAFGERMGDLLDVKIC